MLGSLDKTRVWVTDLVYWYSIKKILVEMNDSKCNDFLYISIDEQLRLE